MPSNQSIKSDPNIVNLKDCELITCSVRFALGESPRKTTVYSKNQFGLMPDDGDKRL